VANQSHILVVEDDPLVSDVVVEALDGIYQTSCADTAAAALECLRVGGIDAILLIARCPVESIRILCRWPMNRGFPSS